MGCLQPINQGFWEQVDGELLASWEVGKVLPGFFWVFWKMLPGGGSVRLYFGTSSRVSLFVNRPVIRY